MTQNIPQDNYLDETDELDGISQRILTELEKKLSCKELDSNCTQNILQLVDDASFGAENDIWKKGVIKTMLFSTWQQRTYFIIRSAIMGLISIGFTFLFVLYFGSIDVTLTAVMGIIVFATSLVITRLFDEEIVKLTRMIVKVLANHRTLRDFIINHF